jgi:acetylornithine/succinyldiaminopimelate/putrescine aminotransferase
MWPKDITQAYHPLLPGIKAIAFNCDGSLSQITEKTAAVIAETVQAEWGLRTPINGYLKKLRQRCDEVGALLILDEIQAGYGRTGTLWAFQQYGIVPDILLTAKGMGGGMPIGAFISSKEIMSVLSYNPLLGHITTFGGHPVSCAAALATLEVLLAEDYIKDVPKKEQIIKEMLQHELIINVRTAGLWAAVEMKDFDTVQAVIKECLELGLITDWFLFNDRSLRIAPPLLITEKEIRKGCEIILKAMDRILGQV